MTCYTMRVIRYALDPGKKSHERVTWVRQPLTRRIRSTTRPDWIFSERRCNPVVSGTCHDHFQRIVTRWPSYQSAQVSHRCQTPGTTLFSRVMYIRTVRTDVSRLPRKVIC